MNEECFQSASSCGKYPYIGDLYLQKVLILLYVLLNNEAIILVKILLDATFSGIAMTESFLRAQIHSENLNENILQHFFSGRSDVHLQVIQPVLKFPKLNSLIKYPKVRNLK